MDIHYEFQGDSFVWNAEKAEINWGKHGIRFEETASVFSDPLFVVMDASHNDEARQAVIGFDSLARLLYVVHIEVESDCIRLISTRRATRDEENHYAL